MPTPLRRPRACGNRRHAAPIALVWRLTRPEAPVMPADPMAAAFAMRCAAWFSRRRPLPSLGSLRESQHIGRVSARASSQVRCRTRRITHPGSDLLSGWHASGQRASRDRHARWPSTSRRAPETDHGSGQQPKDCRQADSASQTSLHSVGWPRTSLPQALETGDPPWTSHFSSKSCSRSAPACC